MAGIVFRRERDHHRPGAAVASNDSRARFADGRRVTCGPEYAPKVLKVKKDDPGSRLSAHSGTGPTSATFTGYNLHAHCAGRRATLEFVAERMAASPFEHTSRRRRASVAQIEVIPRMSRSRLKRSGGCSAADARVLAPSGVAHIVADAYNCPFAMARYGVRGHGSAAGLLRDGGRFVSCHPAPLDESRGRTHEPGPAAKSRQAWRCRARGRAARCDSVGACRGLHRSSDDGHQLTSRSSGCLPARIHHLRHHRNCYPLIQPVACNGRWLLRRQCHGRSYPGLARLTRPCFGSCIDRLALFVTASPKTVSYALIAYTVATLVGFMELRRENGLRHAEVCGSSSSGRQVARFDVPRGPFEVDARVRPPFVGCLTEHTDHFLPSRIVFVLFMRRRHAFDASRRRFRLGRRLWARLYPAPRRGDRHTASTQGVPSFLVSSTTLAVVDAVLSRR